MARRFHPSIRLFLLHARAYFHASLTLFRPLDGAVNVGRWYPHNVGAYSRPRRRVIYVWYSTIRP
jgi:hypothetical protein